MRYLPLTRQDREKMLAVIGVNNVDELYGEIDQSLFPSGPVDLPDHASEMAVERALAGMAGKNTVAGSSPFFVGGGAYKHHVPSTVDHLIQRSEFLTAYTPYQPEISQGTLQVLFEFQTQVAMITGMDVANASMYDGSTACVEAMLMAQRVTRRKKALLSDGLHPQYQAVVQNQAGFLGTPVEIHSAPVGHIAELADEVDEKTACVIVQYPDFYGNIEDLSALARAVQEKGALLVVVVTEIVSLGALRSPGEMGADIVVAEGQSIGNNLNFGGPYVGLFATRKKFVRQMPGRLCGRAEDVEGKPGFVLTLSTREQHIRREKATSNICTNSGLCALAFSIHMTLLGEKGYRHLAMLNHESALKLADQLAEVPGVRVLNEHFFNEFTIEVAGSGIQVVDALLDKGILGGIPVARLRPGDEARKGQIIVAATEVNTQADRDAYAKALGEILS